MAWDVCYTWECCSRHWSDAVTLDGGTQVHLTAGSFNLSSAFLFQILGHYHVVIGIIKVEVGERKVYMER